LKQDIFELDKQESLLDVLKLLALPLISEYRCLAFSGPADGTVLTPSFDITLFNNRYIIIKRFAIYNYYPESGVDIFMSDGTVEAIGGNYRINRLFDAFANSTSVRMSINGNVLPIFTTAGVIAQGQYPADLDVDNIFYKYPEKIQQFGIQVWTTLVDDLQAVSEVNPSIKVVLECYLI
jgi:hypothetical protein